MSSQWTKKNTIQMALAAIALCSTLVGCVRRCTYWNSLPLLGIPYASTPCSGWEAPSPKPLIDSVPDINLPLTTPEK